ncbi:hypothetical protein K435DRAFT_815286 [Dendrothele bispora CBS 962.96]|uniref:DUF1690-domain-containing protein n=1 Tax=Dendrothele bispora (strain CBS 962.96) TaxID=1314807 RepID=A0A4S8MZ71_DENBC|nr:hypothetical protein K435DRAFT_815286 [Dendrothele bispora CBS 962.96]
MGASQSRPELVDEKVFRVEQPIQFSPDVVDQLSDHTASPTPTPERQSTLDEHIRSRIQNEVKQLRKEEEEVHKAIHSALEKENLDREKAMAGDASESGETGAGTIKSSAALFGDLEEIRAKIERFQARKELSNYPEIKSSQEALLSCYKAHPTTALECWREVSKFKASVAQLEQESFKTLH